MKKYFIYPLVISAGCFLALILWFLAASRPAGKPAPVNFSVSRGEGLSKISSRLEQRGIIRSALGFRIYVWLKRTDDKLQAGDYVLNPADTLAGLADKLLNGKVASKRVLIREGETAEEIAAIFEKEGFFTGAEFLAAVKPGRLHLGKYDFLKDKPAASNLEGYLFPDTYDFFIGTTPEQAAEKLLDNFGRKFSPELRRQAQGAGRSVYETLIMASIVEREARKPEDMRIVAGIFWSRLARGQALQSDATLSYFLKDKTAAHSAKELETDTPYNTYKYRGLPPTPISNPGLAAIAAAVSPAASDYNYFLTSTDGIVYYARTYEEHLRNKRKYLK